MLIHLYRCLLLRGLPCFIVQVGEIAEDPTDLTGCTFTIQVAGRPYFLLAEDRSTCKDWVINLNRVREARIQIGRMKLVDPHPQYNDGTRKESDDCLGRVVVSANRGRTHRINNDDDFREYDVNFGGESSAWPPSTVVAHSDLHHQENVAPVLRERPFHALARWEKRRTGLQRMRYRIISWARKIRWMACVSHEHDVEHAVTMPRIHGGSRMHGDFDNQYNYPVGHGLSDGTDTVGESEFGISKDEPGIVRSLSDDKERGYSTWIGNTQISSMGVAKRSRSNDIVDVGSGGISACVNEDGEDGTRTLS